MTRRPPIFLIFLFILTLLLLVIFGTLIFQKGESDLQKQEQQIESREYPEITVADPMRGNTNKEASTIVIFGDYECEFCQKEEDELARVMAARPDIRIVWKNLPISNQHPNARIAAEAALCAGRQGNYWDYHDLLFREGPPSQELAYRNFAERIGIDGDIFERCLREHATSPLVERTLLEAQALGLDGVPYLFINNQRLSGFVTAQKILDTLP